MTAAEPTRQTGALETVHIRRRGHGRDKRHNGRRWHNRMNKGETLCGAPPSLDDISKDSAQHIIKHFAGRPAEERICEECRDAMGW